MIPIERTIRDLDSTTQVHQGVPMQVVTAEYLDRRYIEIYNLRFNTVLDEEEGDGSYVPMRRELVLEEMDVFSRELCTYLRANDIDVTKVAITVYGYISAVIMRIQLHGKWWVSMPVLRLQRQEPPSVRYEVTPGKTHNVYRAADLVTSMHDALSYYDCGPCYYLSDDEQHCGLGQDMWTGQCTKKRIVRKGETHEESSH